MKKSINRKQRIALIITGIMFFLALAFTAINSITNPGFKEENAVLFTGENNAEAGYNVFLKSNPLYDTLVLDKDNFVIKEFVDYIDTSFSYMYTGTEKARLTGDYEIIAMVECYTRENEEELIIWSKPYILSPRETFEKADADQYNINKNVSVHLDEYNNFATTISEVSKINASTRVTVYMNINIKAETEDGTVEEQLSPKIVIPLDTNYFRIRVINDAKPMTIEEPVQTQLPVNNTLVYSLTGAALLFLLMTLSLLIFTEGTDPDSHEKMLNKIFKNHGDRLVALRGDVSAAWENEFEVSSIEDLVRISDDLEKPILYKYNENRYDIQKFYVLNGKEMYILDISENIMKGEKDEKEVHESDALKQKATEGRTIAVSDTGKATW